MNIEDLLTSKSGDVVSIDVGDTIGSAAQKMTTHRIAALVVTQDVVPVGVVSEQDVVTAVAEFGTEAGTRPLSQLFPRGIDSIAPGTSLMEAMSLMTQGRLRHLPVISDDKLVGIVSLSDVVTGAYRRLSRDLSSVCMNDASVGHDASVGNVGRLGDCGF